MQLAAQQRYGRLCCRRQSGIRALRHKHLGVARAEQTAAVLVLGLVWQHRVSEGLRCCWRFRTAGGARMLQLSSLGHQTVWNEVRNFPKRDISLSLPLPLSLSLSLLSLNLSRSRSLSLSRSLSRSLSVSLSLSLFSLSTGEIGSRPVNRTSKCDREMWACSRRPWPWRLLTGSDG